ncbi:BglG family transcription antiterminator [Terrilactibacillus laevilacticus]|uniref:BglG family transcription antiterminator n=1 Tax=Terrilactibacillus laevilacticus TaxID=1380157 RepID=A0ABW5PLK1_9BACI|nr:BglG family transcription antiterminator [Terrilactibacillus laevilacticus]
MEDVIKMISLTKRQMNILEHLLSTKGYTKTKNLAKTHNVSERTIRYDLDFIQSYLKEYSIPLLRKQNHGISLEMTPKQTMTLHSELKRFNHIVLTKEDLIYSMSITLTIVKVTTLERLGEIHGISKNRVFHYIPEIQSLLKKFGAKLERKPSKGLFLVGNEIDIRHAFYSITHHVISNSLVTEDYISNLFDSKLFDSAKQFIYKYEKEVDIKFSDDAYVELFLIMCYQHIRKKNSKFVSYSFTDKKVMMHSKRYQAIMQLYPLFFKQIISDDEAFYLFKQFEVFKLSAFPQENISKHNEEAYNMSLYFAKEASQAIGIDFVKDLELINGLTYHLQVSLNRIKNNFDIENVLTEQIKYKFRFIYEIIRKTVIKLEQKLKITFPEEEIAFISMHFGASYERHTLSGNMPSALVVCGSGLATSSLLASRLKVMVPEMKIYGPINISQLEEYDLYNIDCIISTVHLPIPSHKVIVVNPLLESEDLVKLKKIVFRKAYKKQMDALLNIDHQSLSILAHLIPEKHIQLNHHIEDWRTAIREASNPLLHSGCISTQYVSAMIRAVDELGPYMAFIPEVAIVHASYKDGVYKDGLSLLTFSNPIFFGDKTDVKVKIIIVMSSKKAESDHFLKLVKILENGQNLSIIRQATQIKDILYLDNRDR